MKGKKIAHWIADAVAAGGGAVLAFAAKGAIALGPVPAAVVGIVTAVALKFSRSPVRSEGTASGGGK